MFISSWTVLAKEPLFDSRYLKQEQEEAKKHLVSMPTPNYPISARRLHKEGSGLFWMHFSKAGRVDAVKIAQSTGHPELDAAAVTAFYQWRCRPGELDHVIFPVTFTMPQRSVGGHPID
jgi:TonB family protein